MLLRHAEAEGAHLAGVEHDPLDRFEQLCDAEVVAREQVAQLLGGVATAPPGQLAEVRPVSHAEVLERNEEALVDRLPKPQLDRDAMVEPLGDVPTVKPLRRRRQAEQLARPKMVEEPVVAVGRRVMELVDDDDIERVGGLNSPSGLEATGSSRRRAGPRSSSASVDLAEVAAP